MSSSNTPDLISAALETFKFTRRRNAPCQHCYDLNNTILKATLDDIEKSTEQGCSSCEILMRGISLCDTSKLLPQMPLEPQPYLEYHLTEQRSGYSTFTTGAPRNRRLEQSDRVINGAQQRGCGLCLTYIFRQNAEDFYGTVAEIDIFTKQGTVSSRTMLLQSSVYLRIYSKTKTSMDEHSNSNRHIW